MPANADRSFDYAECRRLHYKQGWGRTELAMFYGVSTSAIGHAIDPAHMDKPDMSRKRVAVYCEDCRKLLTNQKAATCRYQGKPYVCGSCSRLRQHRDVVRPTTLRCTVCREWKPDAEFRGGHAKPTAPRRGRVSMCRVCDSEAKKQWRAKQNPEKLRASDLRAYNRRRARVGKPPHQEHPDA